MSKKGSGPPPVQVTSKPTPPPLDDEAADAAEALAFPYETLADDQPDILDLLSSVLPSGLTDPYAATENGWAVGPQPVDPSSGAPGPSGPLAAYVGANVEALSGEPVSADANAATGGPASDPYETSQTLEQLWAALGRTPVDMSQAVADNSNTVAASNPTTQTATDAAQAPAIGQPIPLGNGNVLIVDPNGFASVYDAQGNQIYNAFSFQNGGGYIFQSTDLSSPNVLFFNDSHDIANAQQPTTVPLDTLTPAIEAAAQGRDLIPAIIDAVSTPTTPADAPPSGIADVLAGANGAPGQGQQNAEPGPSSTPATGGPAGPSQDDENLKAAGQGMWDSYVDLVGDALTGPLGTFGPSGPFGLLGLFAPHPLEWAKFGSPPSTGNAGRDANLLDNYRRGGWVTKTIALAAPIGAEGLLDSGLAATNRLSALGGGGGLGGLGGELGDLGEVTQPLPSELPNSLADEARSGINWNPLRGRPLSDFLPQSGTPRVRVGGFDQGKPSSVDFLGLRGDNGGRIWVSTSPINATHVETLANGVRNGPLSSGKPIEIISGVHGGPPGFLSPEFDFLVQDYGVLPGEQDVNIHNIASMSDAELAKVLESGNEVILAWCDSDLTRRIQEVMGFNFRAAPF